MNRRTLTPVLAALALSAIALAFFSPFYQTNDDVAMRLLAEGNFVPDGEPLPFLMHVNVILGQLLSIAYRITRAFPWYDLLMGGSLTAATAALLYVWRGSGKWLDLVWTLLFALIFLLPSFVGVQFSLAGLGCAAAGIVLLVNASSESLSPNTFRIHLLSGGGLLFWGALIRFEGAVLMILEGAILALPFLIAEWRGQAHRPRFRRVAMAGGVVLVLIVLSFALNQYVYAHARGWQEFHEYNLRRSRINEYIAPERVNPEAVQRLATQVGWSSTDFTLFRNWFFTDPNLYSLARVRQAEQLFYGASNAPAEESRSVRFKRGQELGSNLWTEMRFALFFMALFVLTRARAFLILYFTGVALTIAVLVAGISIALKAPPDRIFWPMLLLGASMLPIASRRWGGPVRTAYVFPAAILAVYLAGSMTVAVWIRSDARSEASRLARRDAAGLRLTGGKFFVLHGNAFPYEDYWRPLRVERTPFPFVALGVSARTPPVQDSLRRAGRSDLPFALCNEPGLIIVAPAFIPHLLTTFLKEHHGLEVRFQPVFEGQRFTAWRCNTGQPKSVTPPVGLNGTRLRQ